jgi:hypothetical protein
LRIRLTFLLLFLSALIVLHQATHGPLWEWEDVGGLHHETYALAFLAAAPLAWRVRVRRPGLALGAPAAGMASSAYLIAQLGMAEAGVAAAAASMLAGLALAVL